MSQQTPLAPRRMSQGAGGSPVHSAQYAGQVVMVPPASSVYVVPAAGTGAPAGRSQSQSFGNSRGLTSPTPTSPGLLAAPVQAYSQVPPPKGKGVEEQDSNAEESADEARGLRKGSARKPKPKLCPNFVEFFNDNVNMMVMAATIASFANGLAGKALGPSAGPITLAQSTMVLCFLFVGILRGVGLVLYRRAGEESTARLVYGTMLQGLPWFLRVPTVVVIPSYLQAIYNHFGYSTDDTNSGQAMPSFVATIFVFLIMFSVLLFLGSITRTLTDTADPDCRWSTFFLQCLYLAAMSGAGKAMHYAVKVPMWTMAGPIDTSNPKPSLPELKALFITICVMTAVAWGLLASTLPNQMDNPQLLEPFQQLHLTCQQYVVVYTWAYATVDAGWIFIYSYVGGSLVGSYYIGFLLFLCWLAVTLGTACVLAKTTPDNSFYDMGKGNYKKAAACLMNYWLVDFITWWLQAQVVTSLDTDVADMDGLGRKESSITSSWPIIGTNLGVLLLSLFVVGAVHACNAQVLKDSASKKHRNKATTHLRKKDSDGADEDDSDSSDDSD